MLARMTEPVHSNSEELRRLYVVEGLTVETIARRLGCGATTVIRRLAALGVPRRPRGPQPVSRTDFAAWSAPLAYAVGLIATDGNLSRDGRHLTMTSVDIDLLQTFRACLGLKVEIATYPGTLNAWVHRLQWGDRAFYKWLLSIGLLPAKSLRLGPLLIPDEFYADFLRGCIDGDGSIITYTDAYNTFKNPAYIYTRLFITLVSASRPFLDWVYSSVARLQNLRGAIVRTGARPGRNPVWSLKYAKRDSIRLLNWLYYSPDVPCLMRKREKALPFLPDAVKPKHPAESRL